MKVAVQRLTFHIYDKFGKVMERTPDEQLQDFLNSVHLGGGTIVSVQETNRYQDSHSMQEAFEFLVILLYPDLKN